MNFDEVQTASRNLRTELALSTGVDLVAEVSVAAPAPPENELHFVRLVAWSYVFLIEVGALPIRHIQGVLRGASPSEYAKVADATRLVRGLRTFQAHQLSDTVASDFKTKQFVIQWLSVHDGPDPWGFRCKIVCQQVCAALEAVVHKWKALTASEAGAEAVAALLETIAGEWPPHKFDRLLEAAAKRLGINGLETTTYRDLRLDQWRKLSACFYPKESAEAALTRAIEQDLINTFGSLNGRQV